MAAATRAPGFFRERVSLDEPRLRALLRSRSAHFLSCSVIAASGLLAPEIAEAACTLSTNTVTCSGTGNTPYSTGSSGVNGDRTLTIAPGATVSGGGTDNSGSHNTTFNIQTSGGSTPHAIVVNVQSTSGANGATVTNTDTDGSAFYLRTKSGTIDVTTDAGTSISAKDIGFYIRPNISGGTAAVTMNLSGDISADTDKEGHGRVVEVAGATDVTVNLLAGTYGSGGSDAFSLFGTGTVNVSVADGVVVTSGSTGGANSDRDDGFLIGGSTTLGMPDNRVLSAIVGIDGKIKAGGDGLNIGTSTGLLDVEIGASGSIETKNPATSWGVYGSTAGGDITFKMPADEDPVKRGSIIGGVSLNAGDTGEDIGTIQADIDGDITATTVGAVTLVSDSGSIQANVTGGTVSGGTHGLNLHSETGQIGASVSEGASVTGDDGVVATGAGTNDITLTNTGHIQGMAGDGSDLSQANDISVENHSLGSMIGSVNGQEISFSNSATYDNASGLTAGLSGSGLVIHETNGVTTGPVPTYNVTVDNTREASGSPGGILAGSLGGLSLYGLNNPVNYVAGENGVFIDNSGSGTGDDAEAGGLIVGVTANGIELTSTNADVKIDNSNTRNGAANDLASTAIDNQVGYDGLSSDSTPTAGTTLLDALVSGDSPSLTYRLNYVLGGLNAPTAPSGGISTGIWGAESGIYQQYVYGALAIDNSNGQIFGASTDGLQLWDIGAYVAAGETVIDVDNSKGGLIEGGQDGVNLQRIQNGGVRYDNQSGATLGGDNGIVMSEVDGDVLVMNQGGLIVGQSEDGLSLTTVGGAVAIENNATRRGDGGAIVGGESGVSIGTAGTVDIDNRSGLLAGLAGEGIDIDGVAGVSGSPEQAAVTIDNTRVRRHDEAGIIVGGTVGIRIDNVGAAAGEGVGFGYDGQDIVIDNYGSFRRGDARPGGLIAGLDGAGISLSDDFSNVSIDNRDTRNGAGNDLTKATALTGDLLSGYEGFSSGIRGATDGVHASQIEGDVTISNQDGQIAGESGKGVDLAAIGGSVTIYNGSSDDGDGGSITGGVTGVQVSSVTKTVAVDNQGGEIQGVSGNGIYVYTVDGNGQGAGTDAVAIDNKAGGLIAGGASGIAIDAVTGNSFDGEAGAANRVFVDNKAVFADETWTAGGLIVGADGDGVKVANVYASVTGGTSGSVSVANQDTRHGASSLASAVPAAEPGGASGIYGSEDGVNIVTVGTPDTGGGGVSVDNQNGIIGGLGNTGVRLDAIYGGVEIQNGRSVDGGATGGYIYGGLYGIEATSIDGASIDNRGGVVVGGTDDGISLETVKRSPAVLGDIVSIDNSSSRSGEGGVVAGATRGISVAGVGTAYQSGFDGIFIDNSGWTENGHAHTGGLIAGAAGDGVSVTASKSDVTIDNSYTRDNGSLGLTGSDIGAGATMLSALSEIGGDFLSPSSTGIWGLGGDGIHAATIAGAVSIDNTKGQIVGTADEGGAGIYLTGIGGGLTPTGTNAAVYITNSSASLSYGSVTSGDFGSYSLISGGDYGVRLGNISNGNVVLNNDLGIVYGDEMGFALSGLTGGDVMISNTYGLIEGRNGSSPDFPERDDPLDSYGAITIGSVTASGGYGGHVLIRNGTEDGSSGGTIIGVSTASAIAIIGGVQTAEIDNGNSWGTEDELQGGLITGSGTAGNPVILLNTFAGNGLGANGTIDNKGIIASTNLYGLTDPDVAGGTGNLRPVYEAAYSVDNYVISGGRTVSVTSMAFDAALAKLNYHNTDESLDNSGGTAASDHVVSSDTGAVEIVNAPQALLFGVVDLTGWNENGNSYLGNTIINYGSWFTQGTNNLVSAEGEGVIHNEGLIQTAFGGDTPSQTTFNLSDFYNDNPQEGRAWLSMLDGKAGDTITVNGNFHGSMAEEDGAYSYLAIDAYLDGDGGEGHADTLYVNGTVSGTTGVVVKVASDSPGGLNTEGIRAIQVNGEGERGSCAETQCRDGDSFYISPVSANYIVVDGAGAIQQGAYAWYLRDGDPEGQTNYDLVSDFLPTLYTTPALLQGATNIFYDASDVVSDHLFGGHFAAPSGGGGADMAPAGATLPDKGVALWARTSGSWSSEDASVTSGLGTRVDGSFRQDSYNLIGGADISPDGPGDGIRFGAYGGYLSSSLDFDAYSGSATYTGGLAGAYVSYISDGFYADAQLNADFLSMTFDAPSIGPGFEVSGDGTTVGVLANVGRRYQLGRSYIEPIASFSFAQTWLDDVHDPASGASLSFGDARSLRAGLGGRIGREMQDSAGNLLALSLTGKVWNEFDGDNSVTLGDGTMVGSNTISASNDGLFGQLTGSASLFSADRTLSATVTGGAAFGDDVKSWSATISLRKVF